MPCSQKLLVSLVLCILVGEPLQGGELLHCSRLSMPHGLLEVLLVDLVLLVEARRHGSISLHARAHSARPSLVGCAEAVVPSSHLALLFRELLSKLLLPLLLLLPALLCFLLLALDPSQLLLAHGLKLLLLALPQLFVHLLCCPTLPRSCFLLLCHLGHHALPSALSVLLLEIPRFLFENAPASILLYASRCCKGVSIRWWCLVRLKWSRLRRRWLWRRRWLSLCRNLLSRTIGVPLRPLALQCPRLLL
mmetsp:Transcript_2495/g.5469  ORF Transcript_2495/g.5469 Transcript_2495/m.5469 type:complete len:249 (+) Transcript_2495:276-1022(+)